MQREDVERLCAPIEKIVNYEYSSRDALIHNCDLGAIDMGQLQDLCSAVRALLAERDEADRRAGAAERRNEDLQDTVFKRTQWLDKAKRERGYHTNVSFDVVWKDACEKADRAEKAEAERDAAYAAGQRDMQERAAAWCNGTAMTIPYGRHEPTHDVYAADEPAPWGSHQGMGYAVGIRALSIKDKHRGD